MSGDTFIAYYGLRFELGSEEIEAIELRSDARVAAAKKVGLKYYWGNFGGPQAKYLLFIGSQIGILGPENSQEIALSLDDAEALFELTRGKLVESGFTEVPAIHLSWQPDI